MANDIAPPAPPCAEIHIHIEGTLEPDLIRVLAERNRISHDSLALNDHQADEGFADQQSFLGAYRANMNVLHTESDFADMTSAYLQRAATAGVRHAEIMFSPQAHLMRGIALETVVAGIAEALADTAADLGMTTRLIASFMRDQPEQEAIAALDHLLDMGAPIFAIGLDGTEVGCPPSMFTGLYAKAKASGLMRVAHAGEEGPPQYVYQALDELDVFRIDHGIRAMEDPELVQRLVKAQTPLTVCPLANVGLKAVASVETHPVKRMLEAGLNVSINSDAPAYFGGYVDDNYHAVAQGLEMTRAQIAQLARNSIRSSVLPKEREVELFDELSSWLGQGDWVQPAS